jgi:hypothetical protein
MPDEPYRPMTEEEYQAATPAERRVAIARDVLAQLETHKLSNVDCGSYIGGDVLSLLGLDAFFDLRDHADAVAANCKICARGALMISKARLADAVRVYSFNGRIDVGSNQTDAALEDAFTESQLDGIEAAFEQWHDDQNPRPAEFGDRFDDHAERLAAIMANIVANGGTFIP